MVFTGTYDHQIDAKHRLAIPSEIRTLLQEDAQSRDPASNSGKTYLYVLPGDDRTLCLYTEQGFKYRAAQLDDSELDPDELLAYEKLLFSLARRVELDKQGRVRLPDNLLKMADLPSEVVLIGVKDHLEVRDRQQWQEHVRKMLADRPGMLMNPRRAMRAGGPNTQG